MCVAITLELKKHPGEKRSTLASQALRLCQLTRSVREAPDAAGHYYARACSLLSMRMFSEAVHDADACLRLQPAFAKARFAKARALYFLGARARAAAHTPPAAPDPARRALRAARRRRCGGGAAVRVPQASTSRRLRSTTPGWGSRPTRASSGGSRASARSPSTRRPRSRGRWR